MGGLIITPANYHGSLIAGPYVSDQRFITLGTSHTKPKPKLEKRTMQKFTDEAVTQFKSELNNIPILESTTLDMAANQLRNEMFKIIEKIATVTTKTITSRHKKPWYDENLKNHHDKQRKKMDQCIEKTNTGRHSKGKEIDLSHKYKSHDLIHSQISMNTIDSNKNYTK